MAEVEQPVMVVTTVAMAMMMQEHTVGGKQHSHTSILKHGGESPVKECLSILKE